MAVAYVAQLLALLGLIVYVGAYIPHDTTNAKVIQRFTVSEGCPVNVGNPVSFLASSGSVRKGAGASLYRNAAQVFFSDNIRQHGVAAIGTTALVAAFSTDEGTNFLSVALRPAGEVSGSAKLSRWFWLSAQSLGPVRPDAVLATSNSTFVVVGGGYGVLGVLLRDESDPWETRVILSAAVPLDMVPSSAESTFAEGGGDNTSRPRRSRTSSSSVGTPAANADSDIAAVAVLSPETIAVSYYNAGTSGNATLVTSIGTLIPDNGGSWSQESLDAPLPPGAGRLPWPVLQWGQPAPYAPAHLSHSIAALSETEFLLAFPLDDNSFDSEAAGFPLEIQVASMVLAPPSPAPGSPADAKSVQLGASTTLSGVRAHYLFSMAALSPSHAVIVFVDAGLNDGIRGVVLNLQRGAEGAGGALGVSFGASFVISSGSGGAAGAGGGPSSSSPSGWRHISLVPLSPPARWWERSMQAGPTHLLQGQQADGAPDLGQGGAYGYTDDDGANGDDDAGGSGHTVVGRDRDGAPFAVVFSNGGWGGSVTLAQGELTPGGELVLTSPAFQVTAAVPPQTSGVGDGDAAAGGVGGTEKAGGAGPTGPSPGGLGDVAPFFWVSATLLSTGQVVVMDTLTLNREAAGEIAPRHRPPFWREVEEGESEAWVCPKRLAPPPPNASLGGERLPPILRSCRRRPGALPLPRGAPPPWPDFAVAMANLTVLEALHNPVGVALTYAGCGEQVQVLVSGLFDYTSGVGYRQQGREGGGRMGGAATPAPPAPAGPFVAGKAYYADSRGRLIEGPYAGTQGMQNEMSGYISTMDGTAGGGGMSPAVLGDTSVPFDAFVGIGISPTQLLVRPGP